MKQWKGHDEEEWTKEKVEKSLLVFSCHRIKFYISLTLIFFANSIYSCFKRFPLTKPTKFVKHVVKVFPATLLEYVGIYVEHIVLQIGNWVIRLFLQISVFSGCFSLFSPVFRLFSHLLSKRRTRLQVLWLAHGSKIADEDLVLIRQ